MKLPRLLSALALGCTLLTLAPSPRALAQFTPVTLTTATLDKLEKFTKTAKGDPDVKAEMDAMDKDEAVSKAAVSGTGMSEVITSKYPKVAAAMKDAGLNGDEYTKAMMSLMMASMTAESGGAADANTPQANIDFAKANKERIAALSANP